MKSTIFLLFSVLAFSNAWTPASQPQSKLTKKSDSMSRGTFVSGLVAGVVANTLLMPVEPAKADVTNKVASANALRNIKRAQKQLPKLQTVAESNDFAGVKEFMRTPPFGDSRKYCFTIVRGAEDGPKAAEIETVYKAFVSSIEKIDGTASLGFRGRKIPQLQLSEEYLVVQSSLADFLKVAEDSAVIPVQYDDAE
mmetsp:Transcript_30132/g.72332  ORF Transcript_30132/g.72332 Transcript_30132/m.72332 type:complete len:196 (+) Transcript_30132:77-664(+)